METQNANEIINTVEGLTETDTEENALKIDRSLSRVAKGELKRKVRK